MENEQQPVESPNVDTDAALNVVKPAPTTLEMDFDELMNAEREIQMGKRDTMIDGRPIKDVQELNRKLQLEQEQANRDYWAQRNIGIETAEGAAKLSVTVTESGVTSFDSAKPNTNDAPASENATQTPATQTTGNQSDAQSAESAAIQPEPEQTEPGQPEGNQTADVANRKPPITVIGFE